MKSLLLLLALKLPQLLLVILVLLTPFEGLKLLKFLELLPTHLEVTGFLAVACLVHLLGVPRWILSIRLASYPT